MSVGALTALIIAITGLVGAIPAIIIAFRAKGAAQDANANANTAHLRLSAAGIPKLPSQTPPTPPTAPNNTL
jgi:hypothetical protein